MPQTHNRKAQNRKAQNRRRLTAPLPEALNNHLRDYAEAAKGASGTEAAWLLSGTTVSVVGLGILALPQLGYAKVVYTPGNRSVNEQARRLKIDFNHDGIPDASISVQGYCNSGSGNRDCFGSIFALGLHGNQAMTSVGGCFGSENWQSHRASRPVPGFSENGRLQKRLRCDQSYFVSHQQRSVAGR